MTKEKTLQAQEERGRQAQELLNHPLIQEAFIKLKGDIIHQFNKTELEDEKKRDNLWRQGQLLDKLEANFIAIVKTGEHAKISLLENAKHRLRNVI